MRAVPRAWACTNVVDSRVFGAHGGERGGVPGGTFFFDRAAGCWCPVEIDFDLSLERTVLNVRLPIMRFEQLAAYKRRLGRDVDRQDLDLANTILNIRACIKSRSRT